MNKYYIYIITNGQRSGFYVGITDKLKYRLEEHNRGLIAWYPLKYKCKYLVFTEQRWDETSALARHKEINGWNKQRLMELMVSKNPHLREIEL